MTGWGSTRALTDESGNVTDTYVYEAFGDILHRNGTTENSYLFTGEQYDPNTGFYYLRARYHNPGNGRFVTQDPFRGYSLRPVSLNKYLYAEANPVDNLDPSGLETCLSLLNAQAISDELRKQDISRTSLAVNQADRIIKALLALKK